MPSIATTQGIKVEVATVFLDDYSKPGKDYFFYCYRVVITNESDHWVKLLKRHWIIIDSNSNKDEIQGEGVIGLQPELEPGESHEYFSFCPLPTEFGTMEGGFTMVDKEGQEFEVAVPRFYLSSNLVEFDANKYKRGQVVHHKLYEYRAVIVDFDMYFLNDEKWYEANQNKPAKNKPWYYVLADDSNSVHYVAEQNLETCDDDSEIEHPLMQFFFNGFKDGLHQRNAKTWRDLNP